MTTRKPKLRFLSALLAVAMMLTLLPTAAFAEDTNTTGGTATVTNDTTGEAETINLTSDGIPDYPTGGSGNGWKYETNGNLTIQKGFTLTGDESMPILCAKVTNKGTIQNGKFKQINNDNIIKNANVIGRIYNNGGIIYYATTTADVINQQNGIVKGGEYGLINNTLGTIEGGLIKRINKKANNGTIAGGTIVDGSLEAGSNIIGGVFGKTLAQALPEGTTYTITADDCTINGALDEFAYCVVDSSNTVEQIVTVKANAENFKEWKLTGIAESDLTDGSLSTAEISFKMPAENVTLTATEEPTSDLAAAIENGVPTKSGSKYSGWKWDGKKLTVYENGEFDLGNKTLSCEIENLGVLTNGKFAGSVANKGTISASEFSDKASVKNTEKGKIFDSTFNCAVTNGSATEAFDCSIENSTFHFGLNNYAKIYDCEFDGKSVYNYKNGVMTDVTTVLTITVFNWGGTIQSGVFSGRVDNGQDSDPTGVIEGGTFGYKFANHNATINGGVFAENPGVEGQRRIFASGSTINDIISSSAYIVGNQKLTIATKAWKFGDWKATGIDVKKCSSVNDGQTVTLTIDLSKVDADDEITLGRIIEPTDLILGDDDLPKELDEDGTRYTGSPEDGWKYVETQNTTTGLTERSLTLYNDYTINFAGHEIDWTIYNSGKGETSIGGIIEDGTFTGSIGNSNKILNGQFIGTVTNRGIIEDGTYLNTVYNYGTVKNGTYAGRFVNGTRSTTDDNGDPVYTDGIVESGVFSRYADFGNQAEVMPVNGENGFNVLWIKLGDATVNDCITEQAGIVGTENIVVTANNPESFDHWSISGDADLTEIKKQLAGHEKDATLHLTLSGDEGGMILLTAETDELPGVLTAKDFTFKAPANLTADGDAKIADVTTEKSGVGEITLHYYDAEGNLLAKAPTKAGTYTVTIDVAATDKYEAATLSDPDWSFTIAEKTYKVTVVNGTSAMTTAAAGAKVTVKANAAPTGQKFSKWVSDSEDVIFVEKTDTETSFIMPESDVTITATYEKLPEEPKPDPKPEPTPEPKPEPTPEPTPDPEPEVKSYALHVFDGETEVDGALVSEAKAGETVTVRLLNEAIPGGQEFDHWEALPETLELKDASATETTFVMPEEAVTLRAVYRDVVVTPAKPSTASVVAATAVVGTGVVLVGWTAYNIGTELYAKWVLPAGAEMPSTRGELAALLWQDAGSPEPVAVVENMTDAEKAAQWAVESGLMTESKDAGFAPEKKVGKMEVFMTLKKAAALKK